MQSYDIIENGYVFTTIQAPSAGEALERLDPPDPQDYGSPSTAIMIKWTARNVSDYDDSTYEEYQVHA